MKMRNLSLQNYPCTCGRSLNKQKSIQNKWFYQKLWFQIEMPIPTKPLNQFKKKKKLCVCVCAHSFSKGELFNFRVYLNNFSLDCRQFNLLFGSFLGSRISQVVLGRQTFKKLINKSHRLCKDKINHENTLKTACSFQSCEKGPKV